MTKAIPNIPQLFFLVGSIDPTKTITLRQRFVREMIKEGDGEVDMI